MASYLSTKVYLDTNVYDRIERLGEAEAAAKLFRSSRISAVALTWNLFEFFAVPDEAERIRRIRALTTVASAFEKEPGSWRDAVEVRREIGRCRRSWLRSDPDTEGISALLKGHGGSWNRARRLELPPAHAYAAYRRAADAGVEQNRGFQKAHRAARQKNDLRRLLINSDPEVPPIVIDLGDPEQFWRYGCLTSWHTAVVRRDPASRDYADWLLPYLRTGAFSHPSYGDFWMRDVDAGHVPRNRAIALCAFHQTDAGIRRSNAMDQLHAGYVVEADVFVTRDRAFFQVLEQIKRNHLGSGATLVFPGDEGSIVDQLAAALDL